MATVSYRISGSHDAKGINAAKASLQSLGKVAGSVNLALKGLITAKAVGAVKDMAAGSKLAFEEAQVSSSRLFQSINNNANLSKGAFDRLSASADKLQSKTIFDADDIKSNQGYLASLGLTETQMNDVMNAAVDMASSGVMPLDSAVKNLAKTYNGSAGELGEMNGKIKALTKEQLKHGDAVKVLAQQYKGMSSAIANAPYGETQRLKVALNDIKETIGQIPAGLQHLAFDKLLSGATDLKSKLNEGIDVLFIALENLPETGKIVFDALGKMFARVFSWDFIGQVLTVCCNQIGRMFTALFDGIKKGFTSIWDTAAFNKDLKQKLEKQQITVNLAYQAKDAKDKELEGKGIVNDYWNRKGADNPEWVKQMAAVNANLEKEQAELKRLQNIEQKNYAAAVWDGISTSLTEATKGTGESLKELGTILDENLGDILRDVPAAIRKLSPTGHSETLAEINAPAPVPVASTEPEEAPASFGSSLSSAMGGLSGILGMLGQLGQVIQALMNGNPIGIIVQAIMAFASMFTSIENVGKVLNLFGTIFARTGEIIEPIVNDMLAPLVDVLEQIGEIVGIILAPAFKLVGEIIKPIAQVIMTILKVLTPLINIGAVLGGVILKLSPIMTLFTMALSLLANTIAWIFNKIIVPIVNFVLLLVTGVGNMIIGIYNAVVRVLRSINIFGWRPFGGMSTINTLDYDSLKLNEIDIDEGSTSESTSTASSSSASYTAAKDITVNVYYNNSYVNGDAREIALSIRKEIKAAEALGY